MNGDDVKVLLLAWDREYRHAELKLPWEECAISVTQRKIGKGRKPSEPAVTLQLESRMGVCTLDELELIDYAINLALQISHSWSTGGHEWKRPGPEYVTIGSINYDLKEFA